MTDVHAKSTAALCPSHDDRENIKILICKRYKHVVIFYFYRSTSWPLADPDRVDPAYPLPHLGWPKFFTFMQIFGKDWVHFEKFPAYAPSFGKHESIHHWWLQAEIYIVMYILKFLHKVRSLTILRILNFNHGNSHGQVEIHCAINLTIHNEV